MTIGERIRQRRKELGLTQEELAAKMGYSSRTAISNVEKGGEDLTSTRIAKYAKALDCFPGYLMGWTNHPNQLSLFDIIDEDENITNTHQKPKYNQLESLTDEEYVILTCYRDMDIKQKEMLKRMLAYAEKFKEIYGKDVPES